MKALIYDLEIKNAILGRGEMAEPGVIYCGGWGDHAGMGIAVLCAYSTSTGQYTMYMDDNLAQFHKAIDEHDLFVGFNNINFDNKVLTAHGIIVPPLRCYDLLKEVWAGCGRRKGTDLESCCRAQGIEVGPPKNSKEIPSLFQKNKIGAVCNHVLHDVWLTKEFFMRAINQKGKIRNPVDGSDAIINVPAITF